MVKFVERNDKKSYKLEFANFKKFGNFSDLNGDINITHNYKGETQYQIVVTYKGYWLYQEYADTLEKAMKLVEDNEEWLYNCEKAIEEKISDAIYKFIESNKIIIDSSGWASSLQGVFYLEGRKE